MSVNVEQLLGRLEKVRRVRDGWMACCPAHADRTPSLSIRLGTQNPDALILKCFAGCPTVDILAALGLGYSDLFAGSTYTSFRAPQPSVKRPPASPRQGEPRPLDWYWQRVWNRLKPIHGTIAEQYLLNRKCVIPPDNGALRYGVLRHRSGYTGPCLVGLITDVRESGKAISLHRTWVQANGTKAPIEDPRLLLAGHDKADGCIRLWPDEAVTYGIAIGEGVETCLSAAHGFRPIWCVLDAGNMKSFPVMNGIETITVIADNDSAGIDAANTCADRWRAAGKRIRIVIPATGDLNDFAQEAA